MKSRKLKSLVAISLLVTMIVVFSTLDALAAEEDSSEINRFNVVVVLDASNSMNYTDKKELRYEAIGQFTNLLAENGNYLGGIVFSNHVEKQKEPNLISKQKDKEEITKMLKSFMSKEVTDKEGYTNIGEALSTAVDLINKKGSKDLPSVILFLSDGNSEMPEDELEDSLNQKADAIQSARENNIAIYSICLNANNKADTSEMTQISNATGGVFQEVKKADDLQDVFNTFYSLIYGTSTVNLKEDVFGADGILETDFDVPSVGVEEVNIVINGTVKDVNLKNPEGIAVNPTKVSSKMYTLIKISDVTAGKWTLTTKGTSGDKIKINMIYNTNLGIDVKVDPQNETNGIKVKAKLKSGSQLATSKKDYKGYDSELCIMDAYGKELERVPMTVEKDHFEAGYQFKDGIYYIGVNVHGNNLEKTSENIGPITVKDSKVSYDESLKEADFPKAVETPVKKTVYIWPFKGGKLTVDMSALAKDPKGSSLKYEIASSSFIEGKDYSVKDNTITMNHFSLSNGSYDIKATNESGLSCNIEVIVKSYNIGIMALIGLGIIGLIVIIILFVLFRIAMAKPFMGSVTAQSYCNGVYKGVERMKRRGRIKLSVFEMEPVGIDYTKSYIQATGSNYAYLVTNKPVVWNGKVTKEVRLQSGVDVRVKASEQETRVLCLRFNSSIKGTPMKHTPYKKPKKYKNK